MLWDVIRSVELPLNRLLSNNTFPLRDVLLYPKHSPIYILPYLSLHPLCPWTPQTLAKGGSSWSLKLEVAMEQLCHVPEQLCWLCLGGLSTVREMRYLNMSRILELAQQGKSYLCWALLGFFKPFAGYCLRKHLYFPLPGVFSLCCFFFFPNSPFFPLPLSVLPISTSLALPGAASFPQAALTTGCSSAGGAVCAAEASFLLVH